jgi:5-methylcytosine-specific restriction endonuclease McrA
MNWEQIQTEIEDLLFQQRGLDVWERALYYHLLRHTRTVGVERALFAIQPLATALGVSESKARGALRSLHTKGCVNIESRSGDGHLLRVLLPGDVELVRRGPTADEVLDIDRLDFFTDRKYVAALVERERGRCFYCLRSIDSTSCVLDHAVPQVNGGDHSYRNVVASCHECNSRKQDQEASDFCRDLYRRAVISVAELEERMASLRSLQEGQLMPAISSHEQPER